MSDQIKLDDRPCPLSYEQKEANVRELVDMTDLMQSGLITQEHFNARLDEIIEESGGPHHLLTYMTEIVV